MIYCNLLKFSFVWNFHNKKCVLLRLTSLGTLKYDCVIKTIKMFNFLPSIDSSVTIGFSILLLIISAIMSSKTINTSRFFLDFILQYLHNPLAYLFNKSFSII